MRFKKFLIKIHWVLSTQMGIDLLRLFRFFLLFPGFFIDFIRFRINFDVKYSVKPCLHDKFEEGGNVKNEYFLQDLFVANLIFKKGPIRHVDVGSRIDGFVANVASFREVEVIDIRPISSEILNIRFTKLDMMGPLDVTFNSLNYCDSLSCLHALEHFGLGRYGDKISVSGYKHGLENMAMLLSPGGTLYLSVPVGRTKVEFNANWIFEPKEISSYSEMQGLFLEQLFVIGAGSGVNEIEATKESLEKLATYEYNLCLFIFRKK